MIFCMKNKYITVQPTLKCQYAFCIFQNNLSADTLYRTILADFKSAWYHHNVDWIMSYFTLWHIGLRKMYGAIIIYNCFHTIKSANQTLGAMSVQWCITFRVRYNRGKIYIGHGRLCFCACVSVCVCLSLAAFPHYCMDPDVAWEWKEVPSSCALLGGFAIGAQVSLLWQHTRM